MPPAPHRCGDLERLRRLEQHLVQASRPWSAHFPQTRTCSLFIRKIEKTQKWSHDRQFALLTTVWPFAHAVHYFAKHVHLHDVTWQHFEVEKIVSWCLSRSFRVFVVYLTHHENHVKKKNNNIGPGSDLYLRRRPPQDIPVPDPLPRTPPPPNRPKFRSLCSLWASSTRILVVFLYLGALQSAHLVGRLGFHTLVQIFPHFSPPIPTPFPPCGPCVYARVRWICCRRFCAFPVAVAVPVVCLLLRFMFLLLLLTNVCVCSFCLCCCFCLCVVVCCCFVLL